MEDYKEIVLWVYKREGEIKTVETTWTGPAYTHASQNLSLNRGDRNEVPFLAEELLATDSCW